MFLRFRPRIEWSVINSLRAELQKIRLSIDYSCNECYLHILIFYLFRDYTFLRQFCGVSCEDEGQVSSYLQQNGGCASVQDWDEQVQPLSVKAPVFQIGDNVQRELGIGSPLYQVRLGHILKNDFNEESFQFHLSDHSVQIPIQSCFFLLRKLLRLTSLFKLHSSKVWKIRYEGDLLLSSFIIFILIYLLISVLLFCQTRYLSFMILRQEL